jgi:hypothetical protein
MGFDLTPLGAIFNFGGKVVDKLFPDKIAQEKERNAAQLALAQLAQDGSMQELQTSMSAILAEESSADPFTSRARPSFMYVIYILILASLPYAIFYAFKPDIAAHLTDGMKAWLAAIPDSLYTLFGVGYLGYTGGRSWEKVRGVSK